MAGAGVLVFAGVMASLGMWGRQLQASYAWAIGYDGCMCQQCRQHYLGGKWLEEYGCYYAGDDRLNQVGLIALMGAGMAAGPWVAWSVASWYAGKEPRSGLCPHCGYDLRGLSVLVCPECGEPGSKS